MANEPPGPTKRTFLDYTVAATADRLVIRPPIGCYVVTGLFLLLSVLLPWVMVEAGLLDRALLTQVLASGAAGIVFFTALWCRWWTLDRKADSVRYFPWRICALTAIRGVRVVERRVGKRNLEIAYTVDLDLEGGARVRFAGSFHERLGTPQARALARIIGEWLNVPVTEEHLSPADLERYRRQLHAISERLSENERQELLRNLIADLQRDEAEPRAAPDPAA
jgi:hypothetical protein